MSFRSTWWLDAVAQIPCVWPGCGRPAQVAHHNQGKGMSLKCDDCQTAAFCLDHHYEIDNRPNLTREQRRALMDRAIVDTVTEMARHGLLAPAKARFGRGQEQVSA